jgi:hypothetical protein
MISKQPFFKLVTFCETVNLKIKNSKKNWVWRFLISRSEEEKSINDYIHILFYFFHCVPKSIERLLNTFTLFF